MRRIYSRPLAWAHNKYMAKASRSALTPHAADVPKSAGKGNHYGQRQYSAAKPIRQDPNRPRLGIDTCVSSRNRQLFLQPGIRPVQHHTY